MAALFFLFLLLLLSSAHLEAQQNIIPLGSSLTPQGPSSYWLSPSGDFAFGFRLIEGNTSSYLLAVWFNKTNDRAVAWYAKTTDADQAPVQVSPGARLQLDSKSGALSLIQDSAGIEVWNPKVTGASYASMLDSGNFVLAAADGSTKWGTFDTPTDTILPTQVLTPVMTLRSRIIPTDYSSGRFLLDLQTTGVSLYTVAVPSGYLYDPYWVMAAANTSNLVFNGTGAVYISLDNGTQITMTSGVTVSMGDYYHRATLDPDGVFRQYRYPKKVSNLSSQAWSVVDFKPQDICQAQLMKSAGSGVCGFNSYCLFNASNNMSTCVCPVHYSFIDEEREYKGCKPDFQPQSCDLDEAAVAMQFELIPMSSVDWPLADYEQYNSISKDQCQQLCLTDCFCDVAVFHDQDGTCWKKKMPLSNGIMADSVERTLFVKARKNNATQSDTVGSSRWKKDKRYWILGSSLFLGSSVFMNILLISAILFGTFRTVTGTKKAPSVQSSSNTVGLPLKAFTYAELEKATSRFQEVLGTGASGIVYKGQLQDDLGTYIAVKKIDKLEHETEKEFAVEVQTIGQTHHKNLVRMLGFCNEGKERLLVYEYMSNGSLNKSLFGDFRLQWHLRAQLALGVAKGLLYLHEECCTQIIHCDIKPQNILLDDNFTAKISDFGLAKLLRTNQTQTNTGIRGTRGYVAPEWFRNIGITAKVDVYSFGVILLELICCRRNVESEVAEDDQKILTYWASDCYRCGRFDSLVEGDREAISDLEKVERYVAVALWCVQEDPTMRPSMMKVVQMLDGAVSIPAPPDSSSIFQSFP